jgi:hypothetical protein
VTAGSDQVQVRGELRKRGGRHGGDQHRHRPGRSRSTARANFATGQPGHRGGTGQNVRGDQGGCDGCPGAARHGRRFARQALNVIRLPA